MKVIPSPASFQEWRMAARSLLAEGVPPASVIWNAESLPLFKSAPTHIPTAPIQVPKGFVALSRVVAHHRSEKRWELLYKILWRLTHGEDNLLTQSDDPDIARAERMRKAVCRDISTMQGQVRFQKIAPPDGERYVAWYAPEHLIVPLIAPFLVRRFGGVRWSVLTPDGCIHWDMKALSFSAGVRSEAPVSEKHIQALWLQYYQSALGPRARASSTLYSVSAASRNSRKPRPLPSSRSQPRSRGRGRASTANAIREVA